MVTSKKEVEPLAARLVAATVGSCSCLTKTPDIQHHDPMCRYRLFTEAWYALSSTHETTSARAGRWCPTKAHWLWIANPCDCVIAELEQHAEVSRAHGSGCPGDACPIHGSVCVKHGPHAPGECPKCDELAEARSIVGTVKSACTRNHFSLALQGARSCPTCQIGLSIDEKGELNGSEL